MAGAQSRPWSRGSRKSGAGVKWYGTFHILLFIVKSVNSRVIHTWQVIKKGKCKLIKSFWKSDASVIICPTDLRNDVDVNVFKNQVVLSADNYVWAAIGDLSHSQFGTLWDYFGRRICRLANDKSPVKRVGLLPEAFRGWQVNEAVDRAEKWKANLK